MGLFENLRDNVTEIGILVIVIVLISILLLNLKTAANLCASGFNFYNTSNDQCCVSETICSGVINSPS